jgi:hypothetical protein
MSHPMLFAYFRETSTKKKIRTYLNLSSSYDVMVDLFYMLKTHE